MAGCSKDSALTSRLSHPISMMSFSELIIEENRGQDEDLERWWLDWRRWWIVLENRNNSLGDTAGYWSHRPEFYLPFNWIYSMTTRTWENSGNLDICTYSVMQPPRAPIPRCSSKNRSNELTVAPCPPWQEKNCVIIVRPRQVCPEGPRSRTGRAWSPLGKTVEEK